MKFGILFFSHTNTSEIWNISEGIVWFVTSSLPKVQSINIKDIDQLVKEDVVWFSNITDTNHTTGEMFISQGLKIGLKVLPKKWLTPHIETLASKMGAVLPEQLDLILCAIKRLLETLKKTIGANPDFTKPLKEQVCFDHHTNEPEPIVKLYFEKMQQSFQGIRLAKTSGLSGYRLLNLNSAEQLAIIQTSYFPEPDGWELVNKDMDLTTSNLKCLITAIKPESLKVKPEMENFPMLTIVKETFLHNNDDLYWCNNHELNIVNKYFDYSTEKIYINRQIGQIDMAIPFKKMDIMSITKCWIADLQIQDLFTSQTSSTTRAWARTILLTELFGKAIDLIQAGINLAFFDYKCFHIQHKKDDLGRCISVCFEHGLEPNAAIFC